MRLVIAEKPSVAQSIAAVLGANDGIISVTSLVVGIAASGASTHTVLVTCIAGLISGAASMAAGEYISVKSQQDIEKNDLSIPALQAGDLIFYANPKDLSNAVHVAISLGGTAVVEASSLAKKVTDQYAAYDEINEDGQYVRRHSGQVVVLVVEPSYGG